MTRYGWALATLLPVLALLPLLALRHLRVIYTSDSTAQQSIVRTWLDVGHGTTAVPRDTWALKVPLYLVVENLPLDPLDRMLTVVLVLNAATFLLLGWATWRLASGASGAAGVRWYEVMVPLTWLAVLGGGLGSNRMLANYRNIELGLCFVMFALLAGYLAAPLRPGVAPGGAPHRRRRTLLLGTGSALLLGVLWFDDPYFALLVGAPLIVAALGWFLVRERDRRLLVVAAVLVGSFVAATGLRQVAALAGIELADSGKTLALSPADLSDHVGLLLPGARLLVGVDRWDGGPGTVVAQILVIVVIVVMLLGSAALAVHGWRERRFVVTFVAAHWPLVVAGFLVSWHTRDISAGRYLILVVYDLVVANAVLLPLLRHRRPALARGVVGLITVSAAFALATSAASLIDAARRPSLELPHQREVVSQVQRAAREHGALKGYAPFWSANVASYLAGPGTTAAEIVCRSGRLSTRQWLSDTARLDRPATAVFLIWDPQATYLRGCSAAMREVQLGTPIATYPVTVTAPSAPAGGVNEVLVYPTDIAARLRP